MAAGLEPAVGAGGTAPAAFASFQALKIFMKIVSARHAEQDNK